MKYEEPFVLYIQAFLLVIFWNCYHVFQDSSLYSYSIFKYNEKTKSVLSKTGFA